MTKHNKTILIGADYYFQCIECGKRFSYRSQKIMKHFEKLHYKTNHSGGDITIVSVDTTALVTKPNIENGYITNVERFTNE